VLIPNPVDTEFFLPGPAAETEETGEDWHMVSSGRLVGWKGFHLLLEAMARLRTERGVVARLTIAGEGPEQAALAAKIAELRLESEVTLAGRLEPEALRDLLRDGDLYVLPSIGMEAFSIGALEAACTGLPLALSDQVGLATYLGSEDALTYPARDVGALVTLLAKFYSRRREVTATARAERHARLSGKFSADQVAEKILALLRA